MNFAIFADDKVSKLFLSVVQLQKRLLLLPWVTCFLDRLGLWTLRAEIMAHAAPAVSTGAALRAFVRPSRAFLALLGALFLIAATYHFGSSATDQLRSVGESTRGRLSHIQVPALPKFPTLSPSSSLSSLMGPAADPPPESGSGHGHVQLLNTTKVATMLEPRMSATLIPLLASYLAIVPPDWPFVIWCSRDNYAVLSQSAVLARALASGRLNLTLLPPEVDIHSGEYLSRFLTRPWFWHQFHADAEWMLFFQSDATLCAASEQSVDDWVGYDWVGSPTLWTPSDGHGGNGGLGIRRISTMQRVTADETFQRADWHENDDADVDVKQGNATVETNQREEVLHQNAEDYWFMLAIDRMLGQDARWPERDGRDQNDFSVVRNEGVMRPLGVHKGTGPMGLFAGRDGASEDTEAGLRRLLQYCPELALIMDEDAGRFKEG